MKIKIAAIETIFFLSFLLAACSGDGGGSGVVTTGSDAILVSISITPANPSIEKGSSQQFKAIGNYSDNSTKDLTASVTWSSTNPDVATISNTEGSKGLANLINTGTTSIQATSSGSQSFSTLVTVTDTSLSVTKLSAVPENGKITLNWIGRPGSTSYNIYWLTTPGVNKANGNKISGIVSTYTHSGLTNGKTYYYVMTTQYNSGESVESVEVQATPSAVMTVDIIEPSAGDLVGKTLKVFATVKSAYQIYRVNASAGGRIIDLTYDKGSQDFVLPGWYGTISLDGLTGGEKVLTVTASDNTGNSSSASMSINYE